MTENRENDTTVDEIKCLISRLDVYLFYYWYVLALENVQSKYVFFYFESQCEPYMLLLKSRIP